MKIENKPITKPMKIKTDHIIIALFAIICFFLAVDKSDVNITIIRPDKEEVK